MTTPPPLGGSIVWRFTNTEGELLMFGWFDRFGIERVAADRGFLKGKDALEGVFVVLLNGDSV
jgi:hypothetical protein